MMKLAFLASNNGSSARAVIAGVEAGLLDARAVILVSNRREAPALAFARLHGVPTLVIPTVADPAAADARLAEVLRVSGANLVVLSGYLRRLGPKTLHSFKNRILNIHPALLPAYGGAGMYGRRVHEAVIAAGDSVSGASVHLVDDEYDHGAVIAQARVEVAPGETAASLEAKVAALEPALFLDTLRRIVEGRLRLDPLST